MNLVNAIRKHSYAQRLGYQTLTAQHPCSLIEPSLCSACRRGIDPAKADANASAADWLVGGALTVLSALVSPTGVLHSFTGVTLVAGYLHARSVDQVCNLPALVPHLRGPSLTIASLFLAFESLLSPLRAFSRV